ncbi:hypothetical protein [Streptomyces sp. NPDC015350]|uniref:hypothetical protein n=1 Tax=Streptomyces sp. NPDC015350 TaxID=3364955 RepID=UPI0037009CC9
MSYPLAPTGPEPFDTAAAAFLRAGHVPYIAMTAGEQWPKPKLVADRNGWINYQRPGPCDRYPSFDVLLARTEGTPSGPVDGHRLSPLRQFRCMADLRCQGCGGPATRIPGRGILWVRTMYRPAGERTPLTGLTDMPPSCARCALHRCPVLTDRGRQLLWVARAEVYGVYADLYPPPTGVAVPERLVRLEDEKVLSAAVATRLVRDLQHVTPADLAEVAELAARQRPGHSRPPAGELTPRARNMAFHPGEGGS